jgi:hypothetical protein
LVFFRPLIEVDEINEVDIFKRVVAHFRAHRLKVIFYACVEKGEAKQKERKESHGPREIARRIA